MTILLEYRCVKCNRLLFKGDIRTAHIVAQCKCGYKTTFIRQEKKIVKK